jgi:hypothetical protein
MERSLDRVIQLLMFAAGKDQWGIHMTWHYHLVTKFVQEFSDLFQFIYEGMKSFLELAGIEFT